MNIDTVTGLPELPDENLFFRVRSNHVEIRRRLPDRYIGEVTRRRWWGKTVVVSEGRYETGDSEHVTWGAIPASDDTDLQGEFYWGEFLGVTGGVRVTRENVIAIAQVGLSRYQDSLLYGDYPPKKLEE
ncbi:hypothetical protein SEA_WATERT_95 [Microbacterium phage WaterT]|nr:hypothetical protein SEA_WATERT_95 [Microbacterium phage WaterT]QDK01495.1 hypothetical protein SEA_LEEROYJENKINS_100 [Microbacterium phage LeeroyJenkins]